ncbi:MAG: IS110 family transposase, partial [Lachnospiraceae bacterium]|nr:IS110 family transposase [Lachnospiraceae bacterium]
HKKAIIAIARMMLICIYNMILTGESFKPSDYDELMNPKPKKPKELTIESAIDFLVKSGVKPETVISAFSQTPPSQSPQSVVS